MTHSDYVETPKGICAIMPIGGSEHTICGDAFDLGFDLDEDGYEWKKTKAKAVTCPDCSRAVIAIKKLKIALVKGGAK